MTDANHADLLDHRRVARQFRAHGGARLHRPGFQIATPQEGGADEARRQDRLLPDRPQGVRRDRHHRVSRTSKATSGSGRAAIPRKRRRTIRSGSRSRRRSSCRVADAIPAEPIARQMAYVAKWPAANWTLAFQGNLHEIGEDDYRLIRDAIASAVPLGAGVAGG